MIRNIIIGVLILAVFLVGGYIGYSFNAPKDKGGDEAVAGARSIEEIQAEEGKPVRVAAVTQETITLQETFYGTVTPYNEANVQGKHGGTITMLKGKEGDSVVAGDVIVRFDNTDTQLQLQQARASKNAALQGVEQAQSNFEMIRKNVKRYQELYKNELISRQALDEAQNQLRVAQAGLASAQEQVKNADAQINLLNNTLKNLRITAPLSGIIDEKDFNLNEIANPGEVIYHIVDIDQVYVEVEIPESYISQIHEQMAVTVVFDSLNGRDFNGVIERILPTGDPNSRNFIAKVLMENATHTVKPGMFARVSVGIESFPDVLVFDKKALLRDGDAYHVFVVVEDHVEQVPVEVQHRAGAKVAVYAPELHPQDRVVVEGARLLEPQDRVKVL
jgi:RND family efflux transporter MFP subunit